MLPGDPIAIGVRAAPEGNRVALAKLLRQRSHGFRNDDGCIEAIHPKCANLPLPPES